MQGWQHTAQSLELAATITLLQCWVRPKTFLPLLPLEIEWDIPRRAGPTDWSLDENTGDTHSVPGSTIILCEVMDKSHHLTALCLSFPVCKAWAEFYKCFEIHRLKSGTCIYHYFTLQSHIELAFHQHTLLILNAFQLSSSN